ncbi:Vegetative incompatibility protein HET-E-1 [Diplonema papillatum]|nr:Vegetative incompatibility protein HET-E-1 [Diplonema papillatum]
MAAADGCGSEAATRNFAIDLLQCINWRPEVVAADFVKSSGRCRAPALASHDVPAGCLTKKELCSFVCDLLALEPPQRAERPQPGRQSPPRGPPPASRNQPPLGRQAAAAAAKTAAHLSTLRGQARPTVRSNSYAGDAAEGLRRGAASPAARPGLAAPQSILPSLEGAPASRSGLAEAPAHTGDAPRELSFAARSGSVTQGARDGSPGARKGSEYVDKGSASPCISLRPGSPSRTTASCASFAARRSGSAQQQQPPGSPSQRGRNAGGGVAAASFRSGTGGLGSLSNREGGAFGSFAARPRSGSARVGSPGAGEGRDEGGASAAKGSPRPGSPSLRRADRNQGSASFAASASSQRQLQQQLDSRGRSPQGSSFRSGAGRLDSLTHREGTGAFGSFAVSRHGSALLDSAAGFAASRDESARLGSLVMDSGSFTVAAKLGCPSPGGAAPRHAAADGREKSGKSRTPAAQRRAPQQRPAQAERVDCFHPPKPSEDPAALRAAGARLFAAVDATERGHVSWEQFLAFLIDATLSGRVDPRASEIHSYSVASTSTMKQRFAAVPGCFGIPVPLPQGMPASFKTILASSASLHNTAVHPIGSMRRMSYVPEIDQLLVNCETGMALLDPKDRLAAPVVFPVVGKLQASVCIPEYRLLGGASSNLTVALWDHATRKKRTSLKFSESQVQLAWAKRTRTLIAGSRSGEVTFHKVQLTRDGTRDVSETAPEVLDNPNVSITSECVLTTKPHNSPLHALYVLPLTGRIVCASLDPQITIQDQARGDVVVSFPCLRAPLCIGFSQDYGLLLAGGMSKEIGAWPVSSGMHQPLTFVDKVNPHGFPVIGVHAVDGSAQVVSLDTSGMVKVWDIRTLGCTQSLYFPSTVASATDYQSLAYIPCRREIVVNTRRAFATAEYRHSAASSPPAVCTADASTVSPPCYFETGGVLITGAGTRIRFWSAITGELRLSYPNLLRESSTDPVHDPDQITAVATDASETLIFIGTRLGWVKAFTACNGTLVYAYHAAPQDEVRHLLYVKGLSARAGAFVIGSTWEGSPFLITLRTGTVEPMASYSAGLHKELADGRLPCFCAKRALLAVGGVGGFSLWKLKADEFLTIQLAKRVVCVRDPPPAGKAQPLSSPPAHGAAAFGPVLFLHQSQLLAVVANRATIVVYTLLPKPDAPSATDAPLLPTAHPHELTTSVGGKAPAATGRPPGRPPPKLVSTVQRLKLSSRARSKFRSMFDRIAAHKQTDAVPLASWHVAESASVICTLSYDENLRVLYAADDGGYVYAYPMAPLVEYAARTSTAASSSASSSLSSFQSLLSTTAQRAHTLLGHKLPGTAMAPAVPPAAAHRNSVVSSVLIVSAPARLVVTSGLDNSVSVWTPLLQHLGSLDPYAAGFPQALSPEFVRKKDSERLSSLRAAEDILRRHLSSIQRGGSAPALAAPESQQPADAKPAVPVAGESESQLLLLLPGVSNSCFITQCADNGALPPQPAHRAAPDGVGSFSAAKQAASGLPAVPSKGPGDGAIPSAVLSLLSEQGLDDDPAPEAKEGPDEASSQLRASRSSALPLDVLSKRDKIKKNPVKRLQSLQKGEIAVPSFGLMHGTLDSRRVARGKPVFARVLDRADHCIRGYDKQDKAAKLREYELYAAKGLSLYEIMLRVCQKDIAQNQTLISRTMRTDRLHRERCRRAAEAAHKRAVKQPTITLDTATLHEEADLLARWDRLRSTIASPHVFSSPSSSPKACARPVQTPRLSPPASTRASGGRQHAAASRVDAQVAAGKGGEECPATQWAVYLQSTCGGPPALPAAAGDQQAAVSGGEGLPGTGGLAPLPTTVEGVVEVKEPSVLQTLAGSAVLPAAAEVPAIVFGEERLPGTGGLAPLPTTVEGVVEVKEPSVLQTLAGAAVLPATTGVPAIVFGEGGVLVPPGTCGSAPLPAATGSATIDVVEKRELSAAMLAGSAVLPATTDDPAAVSAEVEMVALPGTCDSAPLTDSTTMGDVVEKRELSAAMLAGSAVLPATTDDPAAVSAEVEMVALPGTCDSAPLPAATDSTTMGDVVEKRELSAAMLAGSAPSPAPADVPAIVFGAEGLLALPATCDPAPVPATAESATMKALADPRELSTAIVAGSAALPATTDRPAVVFDEGPLLALPSASGSAPLPATTDIATMKDIADTRRLSAAILTDSAAIPATTDDPAVVGDEEPLLALPSASDSATPDGATMGDIAATKELTLADSAALSAATDDPAAVFDAERLLALPSASDSAPHPATTDIATMKDIADTRGLSAAILADSAAIPATTDDPAAVFDAERLLALPSASDSAPHPATTDIATMKDIADTRGLSAAILADSAAIPATTDDPAAVFDAERLLALPSASDSAPHPATTDIATMKDIADTRGLSAAILADSAAIPATTDDPTVAGDEEPLLALPSASASAPLPAPTDGATAGDMAATRELALADSVGLPAATDDPAVVFDGEQLLALPSASDSAPLPATMDIATTKDIADSRELSAAIPTESAALPAATDHPAVVFSEEELPAPPASVPVPAAADGATAEAIVEKTVLSVAAPADSAASPAATGDRAVVVDDEQLLALPLTPNSVPLPATTDGATTKDVADARELSMIQQPFSMKSICRRHPQPPILPLCLP